VTLVPIEQHRRPRPQRRPRRGPNRPIAGGPLTCGPVVYGHLRAANGDRLSYACGTRTDLLSLRAWSQTSTRLVLPAAQWSACVLDRLVADSGLRAGAG
jgi:hypothetical protein